MSSRAFRSTRAGDPWATGGSAGRAGWGQPRAPVKGAGRFRGCRLTVDGTVDGPVENPSRRGITAGEMWMDVWIRKFLQIPGAYLLCWPSRERRNLLSPETGTSRGRLRQRGKDRETG